MSVNSDLVRSAVIYLSQEDPHRRGREKIVCAVNVGDFELKYPVDPKEVERMGDDGRTLRRQMWDEAVSSLLQIVADAGLTPRFVRNDKNSCKLSIKQDAIENFAEMPDEFFSMELFYCSEFELERRKLEYVKRMHAFDDKSVELKAKLFSWKTAKSQKESIKKEIEDLSRDRQFYVATTPDPREMDSGLIFKVELVTTKEYGVTKGKLQTILARYIESLSRIAKSHGTAIRQGLKKVA